MPDRRLLILVALTILAFPASASAAAGAGPSPTPLIAELALAAVVVAARVARPVLSRRRLAVVAVFALAVIPAAALATGVAPS